MEEDEGLLSQNFAPVENSTDDGGIIAVEQQDDDKKKKKPTIHTDGINLPEQTKQDILAPNRTGEVQIHNNGFDATPELKKELSVGYGSSVELTGETEILPETKEQRQQRRARTQIINNPVNKIELTPDQKAQQEKEAEELYWKSFSSALEKKGRGQASEKDLKVVSSSEASMRANYLKYRAEAMQKAVEKGASEKDLQVMFPDSITVGRQSDGYAVDRNAGQKVVASPASETVFPSDNPQDYSKSGIPLVFGSSSIFRISDLQGKSDADIRRQGAALHILGKFNEEEAPKILQIAEEVAGNENLWVIYDKDGKQVPVSSSSQLFKDNQVMFDSTSTDAYVKYQDKNSNLDMIGYALRMAGGDKEKAKKAYVAIQDFLSERKEELKKNIAIYEEAKATGNVALEQKASVTLNNTFSLLSDYKDYLVVESGLREKLSSIFGKDNFGDSEFAEFKANPKVGAVPIPLSPEQQKNHDALKALTQSISYADSMRMKMMLSGMSEIGDTSWSASLTLLDRLFPQWEIKKYVPSTIQAGTAVGKFGVAVGIGAVTGGTGATAFITADIADSMKYRKPDEFNKAVLITALSGGLGRAVGAAEPLIGKTATSATQLGIGTASTGAMYNINADMFKNSDGSTNYGAFVQNLLLDLGGMGFDIAGTGKAIAGKFKKPNEIFEGFNLMLKDSETGKYMGFVLNKETGVLENRIVSSADAEKWMNTQKQNNRQFILQEVESGKFDRILSETGSIPFRERLKIVLQGNNPEKVANDRKAQTQETVVKDARIREKIKTDSEGNEYLDVTSRNPQLVYDDEGNLVPAKSNVTVGKRLQESLPEADSERVYPALKIMYDTDAPLNENSSLLKGDDRVAPTIEDLKQRGFINSDENGNLKITQEGRRFVEQLSDVSDKFSESIDIAKNKYGTKTTAKITKDIKADMDGNQFWNPKQIEESYTIQDLRDMPQKQRDALATKTALGGLKFNPDTGILENTDFTREYNEIKYNFGKKGYENARSLDLVKAINEGKKKEIDTATKNLIKYKNLEYNPENIQAVRDEAQERVNRIKEFGEVSKDRIVKIPYFDLSNKEPELVEPVSEVAQPSSLKAEPVNTPIPLDDMPVYHRSQRDDIVLDFGDGRRHTLSYNRALNAWENTENSVIIPNTTLRNKVKDGEISIIGKVPSSWLEERTATKEGYKAQSSVVKRTLIPEELTREESEVFYKDEANVENLAVFGHTARQWREANEGKKGNVRDYANAYQLNVLDAVQQLNTKLIEAKRPKDERMLKLHLEAQRKFAELEATGAKPIEASQVDNVVKDREAKAMAKLFDNAPYDKIVKLQKQLRSGKIANVAKTIRDIVGEDASLETVSKLFKEAQARVQATDLNVREMRFVEKLPSNFPKPTLLPLSVRINNIKNWADQSGEITTLTGHKIDLSSDNWDKSSVPYFEASTGDPATLYINNGLFMQLKSTMGLNNDSGMLGLTENNPHNFARRIDALAKFLSGLDPKFTEGLKGMAEHLYKLPKDEPVMYLLVSPSTRNYGMFSSTQIHEKTHGNIIKITGGELLKSNSDLLVNILNHSDGKLLISKLTPAYKDFAHSAIAEEVLAYATNAEGAEGFVKDYKSKEVQDAFIRTYDRLLTSVRNEYGENAEHVVAKYANTDVLKAVEEIRNERQRITDEQNRLQEISRRFGDAGETDPRGIFRVLKEKDIWGGSGIKRFFARRYTQDGNPFTLTGIKGADYYPMVKSGADPTFNFFVQDVEGNYDLESEFRANIFKPFEMYAEFNLIDTYTDDVAKSLLQEYSNDRKTLQRKFQELGFDGSYNSDPDVGKYLSHRVTLFDTPATRQKIMNSQIIRDIDVATYAFNVLRKDKALNKWIGTDPAVDTVKFTRGITEKVDTSDFNKFGLHIGLFSSQDMKDGVTPVITNVKNPLVMQEDLQGNWKPQRILDYMLKNNIISIGDLKNKFNFKDNVLDYLQGNPERIFSEYKRDNRGKTLEDIQDNFRSLTVELLADKGYDSIKYLDDKYSISHPYRDSQYSTIVLNDDNLKFALEPEYALLPDIQAELASRDIGTTPPTFSMLDDIYNKAPEDITVEDAVVLVKTGIFSNISAEKSRMQDLKADLDRYGFKVIEPEGRYSGENEASYTVIYNNPDESKIIEYLGKKYDQESVLHANNGEFSIVYSKDGSYVRTNKVIVDKASVSSAGSKFQEQYAGKDLVDRPYLKAPKPEFINELADAYESAQHAPDNPDVQKSYSAFIDETNDQYDSILNTDLGNGKHIVIEAWNGEGEPYKSSKEMMSDIEDNGHYYYLKTDGAYGNTTDQQNSQNVMLNVSNKVDSNGVPLLNNDVFRIVHDLMGHSGSKWQFGIRGEFNAFASHSELYSDTAFPAMMAETAMQNSVVAKHNYSVDTSNEYKLAKSANEIQFAEQKNIIPSPELAAKMKAEINRAYNEGVHGETDGTHLSLKNGNLRYAVDFDFNDVHKADTARKMMIPTSDINIRKMSASPSEISDKQQKLQDADFETWANLASETLKSGFLTPNELKTIKELSDAKDVAKLTTFVANLNKMTIPELIVGFQNSMRLLGISNLTKNIVGNSLNIFAEEFSKMPTSVIELILSGGKERTTSSLLLDPLDTLKSIKAGLKFSAKEFKESIQGKNDGNIVAFEHPMFTREKTTGYFMLGGVEKLTRIGWKFQAVLDRPFYNFVYRKMLTEFQLHRQREQIELGNNITFAQAENYLRPQDYDMAEVEALNGTFQGHNAIASKYYGALDTVSPVTRAFLMSQFPYVKTPLNMVDKVLDYTGLWQLMKMQNKNANINKFFSFVGMVKNTLNNPQDRAILSKAISQGMIGAGLVYLGYRLAQAGYLEPVYDETEARTEKNQMEARGSSYGTVNIDGKNVTIDWITPVSFMLLAGASYHFDGIKQEKKLKSALEDLNAELEKIKEDGDSEKLLKLSSKVKQLEANNPSTTTALRMLINLGKDTPFVSNVISASQKGGAGYFEDALPKPSDFAPQFLKEIAKTVDTNKKLVAGESFLDKMKNDAKSAIPILRNSLPNKLDMFGRPMDAGYGFDAFKVRNIDTDKVVTEFDRLNVTIYDDPKIIQDKKLLNDYRKLTGNKVYAFLSPIVNSEDYNKLSDANKTALLKSTTGLVKRFIMEDSENPVLPYKISLNTDFYNTLQTLEDNKDLPKSFTITDEEAVRGIIRNGMDASKLDLQTMLDKYGKSPKQLSKTLKSIYSQSFNPSKTRTQEEGQAEFEKFKSDKMTYILTQLLSKETKDASHDRNEKWRTELKAKGLSDEKIEKKIRSMSSKLGKSKKSLYNKTKSIVIQ